MSKRDINFVQQKHSVAATRATAKSAENNLEIESNNQEQHNAHS
jgi:hypothetical protein